MNGAARTAFTFPGQGSQRPGMGAAWLDSPGWSLVEAASESLGRDLGRLLVDADAEELRQPREAQISTFLTSMLALDGVRRAVPGFVPVAVAGHSLGEYSALVAAGAVSLADGVHLVGERGEAMQEAAVSQPGRMAAVLGMEPADVESALAGVEGCWVANLNGPGNVVITGTVRGLAAATEALTDVGARRVLPIPVGGAFHSPLMAPAAERLGRALGSTAWGEAEVPVVCNVDASAHVDRTGWQSLLERQLTSPVRWTESLDALVAMGAEVLVEIGPGTVLTGIAKRAQPQATVVSVAGPEDVAMLVDALASHVG